MVGGLPGDNRGDEASKAPAAWQVTAEGLAERWQRVRCACDVPLRGWAWLGVWLILTGGVLLLQPSAADELCGKRLVYYGWHIPETAALRAQWEEIDRAPFDGTSLTVAVDYDAWAAGVRQNVNMLGWQLWNTRVFTVEHFARQIRDIQAARPVRVREYSFPVIPSSEYVTGLHWFDDARFEGIVANMTTLAQIMRAVGASWLLIDPEHYGVKLFSYPAQRALHPASFKAYAAQARARGRALVRAMTAEVPALKIFALHGYPVAAGGKARSDLSTQEYGLLAAFYDGLLEALPRDSVFVDGYEWAYGFKQRRQFTEAAKAIRQAKRVSQAPELYSRFVKVGFGIWLDYAKSLAHFTPAEFGVAVREALRASDRYVWIYSEWVPVLTETAANQPYLEVLHRLRAGCRPSP
jgi:hypothetical protein